MNNYLEQSFGLKGRRAVVTGAGRGIGRAIAEALAAVGAEVLVHYHSSREAAEALVQDITQQGGRAFAAGADLTDSNQVNKLFDLVADRWGALDILVNNAGDLVQRCAIADFSDELIETVLRVNIHTAVYCSRAAIPLLRKAEQAVIVNLSSVAAHNGGANNATLYATAKGAIHTFTRGLAKELAPDIRVNAIAPGLIMTDFHRRFTTNEALETGALNTPLQRLGTAEDMSAAVVFLCGNGASFVTGEVIELNGGIWIA